ncbi:3-hydroxylacyl-ACP dehydratase [Treponema primitia]|uniref:ApeP family dehydratase n=1 Tax=Treponema primitia TaxID=88058 RepID=UPI00397F76DA
MIGGNIERDELLTLLPHKGKMFLLSRILAYDTSKRTLRAEYDITRDCLFYDPELGGVPAWVSFEFMAQSISSLSGLVSRERGEPPKLGCILSVSNMEIKRPLLKAGTTVCIDVNKDCMVEGVFSFDCTVSLDGTEAVAAKLMVMDVDDLSIFTKGA